MSDGEFGSVSDVISTSLAEFLVRYDDRRKSCGNPSGNARETLTRPVVIE